MRWKVTNPEFELATEGKSKWLVVSQETVRVEDTNPEVWYNASVCEEKGGDYLKALQKIDKAISYCGGNSADNKYGRYKISLLGGYCTRLYESGRYEDVIEVLKADYKKWVAFKISSDLGALYKLLAEAEWKIGDKVGAIGIYAQYYGRIFSVAISKFVEFIYKAICFKFWIWLIVAGVVYYCGIYNAVFWGLGLYDYMIFRYLSILPCYVLAVLVFKVIMFKIKTYSLVAERTVLLLLVATFVYGFLKY